MRCEMDCAGRPGVQKVPVFQQRCEMTCLVWPSLEWTTMRRSCCAGVKAPAAPLRRIILDARDALRPFEWSQYLRGTLEYILTGAVRTQERLFKAHDSNGARLVASFVCPCCGEAGETQQHLFWQCQRWNAVRSSFPGGLENVVPDAPASWKCCGLAPEFPLLRDLEWRLESVPWPEVVVASPVATHVSSLTVVDGYVRVWTDGACERQADRRFRRAGFGVWLHENAEWFNRSRMVPGEQSNQRGELMALWVAFATAWSPICVVTDSQYCVALWTRLTEDPTQSISHWDHSDVWLRLQDLLLQSQDMEERPFFVVHKTLGHADELDF